MADLVSMRACQYYQQVLGTHRDNTDRKRSHTLLAILDRGHTFCGGRTVMALCSLTPSCSNWAIAARGSRQSEVEAGDGGQAEISRR